MSMNFVAASTRLFISSFDFKLAGFRSHQAKYDLFTLGNQPQRLKAAGAFGVVFHEISIDIRLVEQDIGNRVVTAGALKGRAKISTA